MRIVMNSGDKRSVHSMAGSIRDAMGHTIRAARDTRLDASKALKSVLFPTNGAYHKAKRRGERAMLAVAG